MAPTFTCILLLLSLPAAFGKYVYVDQVTTWLEARDFCRNNYIDLAPISNSQDDNLLRQLAVRESLFLWIGLTKSPESGEWMWSGGGQVPHLKWASNNNVYPGDIYGSINELGWYDTNNNKPNKFVCYNAIVVGEKMTWVEAMEYCRQHHRELASTASETEMLLIQGALQKHGITDAWVGLHFLSGDWLWVDKQPLVYESWVDDYKPPCPLSVYKDCAVLQTGGTQAVDCEERHSFVCYEDNKFNPAPIST